MATMLSVTPESIARAKAAQRAERANVTQQTGVRFEGDQMVPPSLLYVICCSRPGCRYAASAQSEGRAVRALSAHLVQVHVRDDSSLKTEGD